MKCLKLKITKNDGFRGITILESNYSSIGNELSFDLNLKIGDRMIDCTVSSKLKSLRKKLINN